MSELEQLEAKEEALLDRINELKIEGDSLSTRRQDQNHLSPLLGAAYKELNDIRRQISDLTDEE